MTDSTTPEAELLVAYRRTLAHLLKQAAAHGGEHFAPPEVAAGVAQARAEIVRLKHSLRSAGEAVPDEVMDTPIPDTAPDSSTPVQRHPTQINISIGSGGSVGGPVIANTGTMTSIYAPPSESARDMPTLDQALARLRAAQNIARERGDDDFTDDLQPALLALEAAHKAHIAQKQDRYARKLVEARDALDSFAANPEIAPIVQLVAALVAGDQ